MLKMDKKNVFILIFVCFLVSNAVCKEEPNNYITESYSEVNGFKNPSARHADVPLRSILHKFSDHTTPITESPSSYDERIGLLDKKALSASKNDLTPRKLATDVINDKIKKVSTMRKLLMKRSARMYKLKVLSSLHGARMSSTAAGLGNKKDENAFPYQITPPSSSTGELYEIKINTPLKLTILPTEETVIPSVDPTDAESDWILTQDNTAAEEDEEKSSHSNDHKDNSVPHGEPKVTGHDESTRHGGTSAILQHKMAVHPNMKTSSGLRWNMAYEHAKLDDSKKGKRFKKKKKKSDDSGTEDRADSDSSAAVVAGIVTGILMLLFIFSGVPRLWRICKKRWRRRHDRMLRLDIPSTGYLSEELSEEEVIFDRTAKKLSKGSGPKPTPNTSPRRPKSAPASYQTTNHESQEQKIWTLTNTPKSTPLMAVPTVDDTLSTEVWTVNEIPESKSLDSLFTTSALPDSSTWTPVTSPHPLTTQSRPGPSTSSQLKIPESPLSPHPSTSKKSLRPTASDELTRTFSMATDSTSSSTESCKAPVAPRNEVVITVDDDDEIIYTSEKLQEEELSTVKDFDKETSRDEVVIRIEHDDDKDESLMVSESEATSEKMIYTSENLEMNNVTTDGAVIDIMTSDVENEGLLAVNDSYSDDEPPLTLPTIPPSTASPELQQGKSLIGGRKALENRRFIKHLISEQESTGFKRDLNTAISRILGEKKRLEDKNKGKRNVIKHQTRDTTYSLGESILSAKSMIMNENVDKERDKRSFLCRQVIQQTLSYPIRAAFREQRTLAQEIAFAKEIIFPGRAHPRAAVRTKAKRQARCKDESRNLLDSGASTSNLETKTKYMNHKDYQKWKLLQKDAKVKQANGSKPGVSLPSLQQVVSFFNISIPDVDYDVTVCRCYYCDKHKKKERAKKLLLKSSRFHCYY